MQRKVITTCPVCESGLEVTHLTCRTCGSVLQGHFEGCKYCQLPQPLFDFLESFVKCRGVIRDLEKEIGMSYPAVKSRIEKLLAALGHGTGDRRSRDGQRQEVLEAVQHGTTSVEEAIQALRRI